MSNLGSCGGRRDDDEQAVAGSSTSGWILRSARESDAQRIVQVLRASRQEFLPHAPSVHSETEDERWVRQTLIPADGVTVAEFEGAIVGVLAISVQSGIGWVDQLYVQPGFERRGIGRRLLAWGLGRLPRPVRLYTFQESHGARRFYERAGFKVIGYGDGSRNEEGVPDVLYELK